LDLWGRLNALEEAEEFRAEAAQAFMETAAITVSSEVALAWYRLAGAKEQKRVLLEQIETNRTVLELIEARFKSGQVRSADVLRQRQFVEATIEETNDVSARIAVLEHLLSILQGRPPQEAADFSSAELVALPVMPDVGLPAELLQRRPDVREAFLNLRASDAELAAAISD
jgi:outer membrane protein TolC